MSHLTGSTGGASELPRHGPLAYPAASGARRLAELPDDVAVTPSGGTDFDSGHSVDDRDAAVYATASCGISRDGGVWVSECAWCMRVRTVSGDWVVITAATLAAMRVERTHGICPQCSEGVIARASGPPPR